MSWFDRLGSVASGMCALHCAVMSGLPAAALVVGGELNETLEWSFFAMAAALAAFAAAAGYRTHGSLPVLIGFGAGLGLLCAGRAAEALSWFEGGGLLAVAGGGVLVASHLQSLRCGRACASSSCSPDGVA